MPNCTGRVGLVGSLGTLGGRAGLIHTWWQGGAHSHLVAGCGSFILGGRAGLVCSFTLSGWPIYSLMLDHSNHPCIYIASFIGSASRHVWNEDLCLYRATYKVSYS